MIFHQYKCIFVHIPKCGGTSIARFLAPGMSLDIRTPNYANQFGWCPERKLHLQHATTRQLIETNLIGVAEWDEYFKFTFVRNPWDRAYSDYLWMLRELNIGNSLKHRILGRSSFRSYITKRGLFSSPLRDSSQMYYRGDHLKQQVDFFDLEGRWKLDFVGRFEHFDHDVAHVLQRIGISERFDVHENKSTSRLTHYSEFYTRRRKRLVDEIYARDIHEFEYSF